MRNRFTILSVLMAVCLFVSSCASSYKSIRPETLQYPYSEVSSDGEVSLSYQYDVLALRKNKKYVKRELKNSIKVVAIKFENKSSSSLLVGRDCQFLMGDRIISPLPPESAAQLIKQPVPIYLLYMLLNFNVGGRQDPYTGQVTGATFLPTGPFIAGGNMLVAHSANKNMEKEIVSNSILTKTVEPGQTVYGTLCLRESFSGPIKVKVIKNTAER